MKKLAWFIIIAGTGLFFPQKISTCPIPVFRYALEYWEADKYRLEIFYKDSPGQEEKWINNYLRSLQNNPDEINLEIKLINIGDNNTDTAYNYLNTIPSVTFPWMVLKYPNVSGIEDIVWAVPCNYSNFTRLVSSPAREKISLQLSKGATAVWILLESGDKKKDQAALELMTNELKRLEETLKLPDPELWWDSSKGIPKEDIPGIKFEIIKISRLETEEEPLVNMLLNSEPDLNDFSSEPMIFPVFGRGIALYAIVGKGINAWNIREAAEFIIGPCSCQAKLLNPGVDLLIALEWDKVIENITDINIANPLSTIGNFTSKEEDAKQLLESATNKYFSKSTDNKDSLLNERITVSSQDNAAPQLVRIRNNKRPGNDTQSYAEENKQSQGSDSINDAPDFPESSEADILQNRYEDNEKSNNFILKLSAYIIGFVMLVLLAGYFLYKRPFR